MIRNARGVTLMELLLAGTIAAVAMTGIHMALNSAFYIERQIQRQGGDAGQNAAALAMIRVAQRLEIADRFVVLAADDIQLRIPPADPVRIDTAAQYHWERYKYNLATKSLLFYPAGDCGNPETLTGEIDSVSFAYRDEGLPPPGGNCFAAGEDCNFIEYQVRWNNGLVGPNNKTQEFRGLVASRNIADSNVAAAGSDSGNQLFPAPDPPAPGGC